MAAVVVVAPAAGRGSDRRSPPKVSASLSVAEEFAHFPHTVMRRDHMVEVVDRRKAERGRRMPARLDTGHIVERVGLFVIIVLGESVIALVTSADHTWTLQAGVVGVLGFVLLAALWWSYFDFGSTSAELMLAKADDHQAYLLARDIGGFLHFFVTAGVLCMAAGLATAVEEADHAHLPTGAVWALADGLALYHAAHACIALRYGRPPASVAVWAVPGICIPLLVVRGAGHLAPWLVVLLLAAEAIVHLLYARKMLRHRLAAAAAPAP
ncbi:low temperature requirement protein A [Streptomyces sp. NPDC051366]|uniref:low temperature requirement protein A n=1 Tax=Streptomyces sp. NPDC051366 TaxID=3365652 RepID=UPI003796284D